MPDKPHGPPAPSDIKKTVTRYYDDCMASSTAKKKGNPKEYCARVAWQRFCMYKDPEHPSCTKFGKTKATMPEGTVINLGRQKKHDPSDLVWGNRDGKPVEVGQKVVYVVSPGAVGFPPGTYYIKGVVAKVIRRGADPRVEFRFESPMRPKKMVMRQMALDKEPGNLLGWAQPMRKESRAMEFKSLFEMLKPDGAITRDEFNTLPDVSPIEPEERSHLESFVLSKLRPHEIFATATGKTGIVYHDVRGRATATVLGEMDCAELRWLAERLGHNNEQEPPPPPERPKVEADDHVADMTSILADFYS